MYYLPCPSCLLSSISTHLFALHICLHLHTALTVWQLFAELHLVQKSQISAERVGVLLPQTEPWLTLFQGQVWHCLVWISHSQLSEFPCHRWVKEAELRLLEECWIFFTLNKSGFCTLRCFVQLRQAHRECSYPLINTLLLTGLGSAFQPWSLSIWIFSESQEKV